MEKKKLTTGEVCEADRQFLEKSGVTAQIKDLLAKFIENRPENTINFLSDYFESIADRTDKMAKAKHQISMTHFSKPAYHSNVIIAYDILSSNKGSSRIKGVSGVTYMELLNVLTKTFPTSVRDTLLHKLHCRDHEVVVFDIFKSGVYTCVVLQEFIKTADELYRQIDVGRVRGDTAGSGSKGAGAGSEGGKTGGEVGDGNADALVCTVLSQQLKEAVNKSTNDTTTGLLDAGYSLAPARVYTSLATAMFRGGVTASVMTRDEFVASLAETFLTKVNVLR